MVTKTSIVNSPTTLHAAFETVGGGMAFNFDRDGLQIDIGIFEPTEEERVDYLEGPIAFALVPMGPVLFLLANIGGHWACDAPFSIQIEPAHRQALPWSGIDPAVVFFHVNIHVAHGDEWQVIRRAASLSTPMLRVLRESVVEQLRTPLTRAEYERIVRETFAKYPKPSWLLKKAIAYEVAIPDRLRDLAA